MYQRNKPALLIIYFMKKRLAFVQAKRQNMSSVSRHTELVQHSSQKLRSNSKIVKTAIISSRVQSKQYTSNHGTHALRESRRFTGRKVEYPVSETRPQNAVDSSFQKNGANLKNKKSASNSRAMFELPQEIPQFALQNPQQLRIAKKSVCESKASPGQLKVQLRISSIQVNIPKQDPRQKQQSEILTQRSNRRSKAVDEHLKQTVPRNTNESPASNRDCKIETVKIVSNSDKPIKEATKGKFKPKGKQPAATLISCEQGKGFNDQKPQAGNIDEAKPSQQPDLLCIEQENTQEIKNQELCQNKVKVKQIASKKQVISKQLTYKQLVPSKSRRKRKAQSEEISSQEGWNELPKRKRTQHSENLPFKSKKKRKIIYNNEENSNEIDGDDSAGEPNALNKSENKSMNEENIYHSSSSEDLAALLKKLDRKSYLSSKPLDQVDEFNNNIMVEGKKELQPVSKNLRTKQDKEAQNWKRKRPQSERNESDDYQSQEKSLIESSQSRVRKKTSSKNRRSNVQLIVNGNDDSDLGEKPVKKLKKSANSTKKTKRVVKKFESASDEPSEETFERDNSRKQAATSFETPGMPKLTGSKRGSILQEESPNITMFTSLKDRLAVLQSEMKKAERQEPILTTGPIGLAQSRISQLINSTVSNHQKANKNLISQILGNLTDPISKQPTSLFPDRNNSLKNADNYKEETPSKPKAAQKCGEMDLQYQNKNFYNESYQDESASKLSLKSKSIEQYLNEGNETCQKPAKKHDFSAYNKLEKIQQNREIYQSNVSKYIDGLDNMANKPSNKGNETSSTQNQLNQLLSKFNKHVEAETSLRPPNRMITELMAPIDNLSESGIYQQPIALSVSYIPEKICQCRQVNDPVASQPELSILQTKLANTLETSSVQSTLNMSCPRVTLTTQIPNSRVTEYEGSKTLENKHIKLCDLFTSEGYEVMIEEGTKNITACYPDMLVAVSYKMKGNFKKFGDLLSFQIVTQQLIQVGQSYQHCRLGVFTVFNSNRRPLLAGYAIIFSSNFNNYHRVFEFFLDIHQTKPESILTSYSSEMIEAVAHLQKENIFTGAHVLNAKDIITILQKEIYGTVAFNDRTSKTELFLRFITEKSKDKAYSFEKEIARLSSTMSSSSLNKRTVNLILSEKSKICYSWIPNNFIGISMQQSKEYYNTINKCYRCYQSNSHEFLIKQLILIDKQMLNEDTKLVFYADPVETIFQDHRLKNVRLSLDTVVFKTFLKNYTQAYCFMTVISDKLIKTGTFETNDRRTNEVTKVTEWICNCLDQSKTGVGCQHMLAGAKTIIDFDYLNLIRKRWKNTDIKIRVSSAEVDKINIAKDSIEVMKTDNATTKLKVEATGVLVEFEEMEYYSDDETDLSTIAAKRKVK